MGMASSMMGWRADYESDDRTFESFRARHFFLGEREGSALAVSDVIHSSTIHY